VKSFLETFVSGPQKEEEGPLRLIIVEASMQEECIDML
jgi:hypothetical protein